MALSFVVCDRAQYGYTPLHKAALNGHLECARLLLERGADKDANDTVRVAAAPLAPAKEYRSACAYDYARRLGAEARRCYSLCVVVAHRMAGRRCTGPREEASRSARGCCWSAARKGGQKTACAPPLAPLRRRATFSAPPFIRLCCC